jgi:hypothetical protein
MGDLLDAMTFLGSEPQPVTDASTKESGSWQ